MNSSLVRPCIRCSIRESKYTDPTWLPVCEECESEIFRLPHDEMIKEQARYWQLFDEQRLGHPLVYPELEKEVVWRAENPSGGHLEEIAKDIIPEVARGASIKTTVDEVPAADDFPAERHFTATVIDEEGITVLESEYTELEDRILLVTRYVRPGYAYMGYGTKSFIEGPLALSVRTGKPMGTSPLSEDGVAFYRALEVKGIVTITSPPEYSNIFTMEPGWKVK